MIRGDTAAGAATGGAVLNHLTAPLPESPSGTDAKSVAIAVSLSTFLNQAAAARQMFNDNVDTLRTGMVAAPTAVEQRDAAGAAAVTASGGIWI